jgi:hypothetical protein
VCGYHRTVLIVICAAPLTITNVSAKHNFSNDGIERRFSEKIRPDLVLSDEKDRGLFRRWQSAA